ncbi:MAG: dimethylargininase [Balneolaceae bacterium]|nr:MAG: dimethylargininase [Balneolaceae bacterium]
MPTALTRAISPLLGECELTHLQRSVIDIKKAQNQQKEYENALENMGYTIRRVPDIPHLPDGVFVEDAAVVFPEIGIITRPGAKSRRPETESVAAVLSEYRDLKTITAPGTLDGGDVLTLGKQVFVGISERTNTKAIQQFVDFLKPYGYSVTGIPVTKCLHLKTAIAVIDNDLLLINPEWIDESLFPGYRCEYVSESEPYGANVIRKDNWALCPKAFTNTAEWLQKQGYDVIALDQSELAKAEAGLTCCSILVDD